MEPPEPPQQPKKGVTGLANLGNTCYMNSAIQALRHYPEFSLFCTQGTLEKSCADKTTDHYKIAVAFVDLIQSLWAGSSPSHVLPRGFFEALSMNVRGTIYESFIQRSPQDSHEFIVWILDQIFMATQTTPATAASDPWSSAFKKAWSPMADLFFGMLRIQYKCSVCKTVHNRYETFNTLKIQPIAGKTFVESIQDEILATETIDEYDCDACNTTIAVGFTRRKSPAEKSSRIWKLPKLLIFTIKRYTPFGQRDNTPIVYNGDELKFDKLYAAESPCLLRNFWYRTISAVDHFGAGMHGGHYVAQAISPVWKEWYVYDDEATHKLDAPHFGSHTYMIFMRATGQT
jgi:ubiquitin C-terminal hydrolase